MLSELLENAVETKPYLRLRSLILSLQMGQKIIPQVILGSGLQHLLQYGH